MKKDLWNIIKETAEFYGLEMKSTDKKNAGVYIKLNNEKVKINSLSEKEIFENILKFDDYKLNYFSFVIEGEKNTKSTLEINTHRKDMIFYNTEKFVGKVA